MRLFLLYMLESMCDAEILCDGYIIFHISRYVACVCERQSVNAMCVFVQVLCSTCLFVSCMFGKMCDVKSLCDGYIIFHVSHYIVCVYEYESAHTMNTLSSIGLSLRIMLRSMCVVGA